MNCRSVHDNQCQDTYHLSRIVISRAEFPDGLDVVPQRMQFVGGHIESASFPSLARACDIACCPCFGVLGTPASCTSCRLTREVISVEFSAGIMQEPANVLAKAGRAVVEMVKCCLGMHLKFAEGMPCSKFEQEVDDDGIVWFREETVKDGYSTLKDE